MSAASDREASDIDMGVGSKPWRKAPPKPPTAAQLEAEWVQVKGARKGISVNARTGMYRYIPT